MSQRFGSRFSIGSDHPSGSLKKMFSVFLEPFLIGPKYGKSAAIVKVLFCEKYYRI